MAFITFLPADLTTLASKSSVLSRLIAHQLWPPALAGASQSLIPKKRAESEEVLTSRLQQTSDKSALFIMEN